MKAALTSEDTSLAESEDLRFLWLEVTRRCNLECVHCYSESGPRVSLQTMSVDDWRRMLSEGYAAGCRAVQFIGGEPTLYPELPELIRFARALGYSFVEIYTNGTAFTAALKKEFMESRVALAFSVYSSQEELHDAVTLHSGSQPKTVASIRWALENGLPVRVSIIDVGINQQTIAETSAWLRSLGVILVDVDRERGVGRAAARHTSASQLDELCGHCWEGKLCVTAEGAMYPCIFARQYPVGSTTDGLSAALSGVRLRNFRRTLREREITAHKCTPQCGPDCPPAQCSPHTCAPTTCRPVGQSYGEAQREGTHELPV